MCFVLITGSALPTRYGAQGAPLLAFEDVKCFGDRQVDSGFIYAQMAIGDNDISPSFVDMSWLRNVRNRFGKYTFSIFPGQSRLAKAAQRCVKGEVTFPVHFSHKC